MKLFTVANCLFIHHQISESRDRSPKNDAVSEGHELYKLRKKKRVRTGNGNVDFIIKKM